jgi:hypothetical protein
MAPKSDDKAVELMAETETKKKDDKNKKSGTKDGKKKKKNDNGDVIDDDNAMSEEDRQLKERLETCVSTLINEANEGAVTPAIRLKAIDVIVSELRSATSSMTSVPKPLKFLRPKYDALKGYYGSMSGGDAAMIDGDREMVYLRARLGDVLAVLAMTLGKHGEFFAVRFFYSSFFFVWGWEDRCARGGGGGGCVYIVRINCAEYRHPRFFIGIRSSFHFISPPHPLYYYSLRRATCDAHRNDDRPTTTTSTTHHQKNASPLSSNSRARRTTTY